MIKYQQYLLDRQISLTDEMFSTLDKIREITLETNKKFNLTAITDVEQFNEKMIVDSALCLKDLDLSNKTIIDVGTGAGFPGLVIATIAKDAKVTLLDSTSKKIDHLDSIRDDLNLKYNCVCARAEEFSIKNRETFDYAIARAVAPLNILLEIIIPLLKVGGCFICMKGPGSEEEINQSQGAFKKLGCRLVKIYSDELPNSHETRHILYICKEKETNHKYPRLYKDIKEKPLR